MENRFPIRDSRFSTSSALGHRFDEDELRRNSFASSGVLPHRNSTALSSYRTSSLADRRDDSMNTFDTPPDTPAPEIHNVFATPTNSAPVSPSASMVDVNVFSTPPPSIHRNSFSLSLPRSPSPIPVADGHRGPYYGHHRSVSLSRSVTPSLSTSSGYTGPTLNRSNTAGTSNSSTLYSIPSHMSQISSPPSPLQSIAPVRPRFDYGGHQQTLSLHDSEIGEVDVVDVDPFSDGGFVVPVGDGFAPHRASRGPLSSAASDVGTLSLPPPYTQYPELQAPKPEHGVGFIGARSIHSDRNSASSTLGDREGQRQSRRLASAALLPAAGAGAGAAAMVTAGAGAENEAGADNSGAHKEWKEKKWMGGRVWVMVASGLVALLVGLAVGLGVGLGIGYKKGSSSSDAPPPRSTKYTTTSFGPAPENTGPPTFDKNGDFPPIPDGSRFISPLQLDSSASNCAIVAEDPYAPDFFKQGASSLWDCNIPNSKPLLWNIVPLPGNLSGKDLGQLKSDPKPIPCAEYSKGRWGGFSISSETGENEQEKDIVWVDQEGQKVLYSGPAGWREGMQGPAFWKEPLTFFDPAAQVSHAKRSDSNSSLSYKFGILYNKTVILREKSLIKAYKDKKPLSEIENNESDSTLEDGEVVWMCTWEKSLLEVEILINEPSLAITQKGPKHHGVDNFDYHSEDDNRKTTITIGPSSNPSPMPSEPPFSQSPPPPFESPPPEFWNALSSLEGHLPSPVPEGQPAGPAETGTIDEIFVDDEFDFVGQDDDGDDDGDGGNSGRLRRRELHRRGGLPPREYPLKVQIFDYRPSKIRLKDVQGIDRTEGDTDPRVKYGEIKCTKMIVVAGGGLRTDKGANGEGEVYLKQRPLSLKRKRDITESPDCFCKWSS